MNWHYISKFAAWSNMVNKQPILDIGKQFDKMFSVSFPVITSVKDSMMQKDEVCYIQTGSARPSYDIHAQPATIFNFAHNGRAYNVYVSRHIGLDGMKVFGSVVRNFGFDTPNMPERQLVGNQFEAGDQIEFMNHVRQIIEEDWLNRHGGGGGWNPPTSAQPASEPEENDWDTGSGWKDPKPDDDDLV